MRRMTAILGAAALVLATAGVFAQGKTSFAGKWSMVPDPNAAAGGAGGRGGGRGGGGGGGFACGMECTITQDAATLKVSRMGQNGEVTSTFKLDGTDSSNPGRGGDVVSKAAWDGAKLVITTGDAKQTLSLEGGNLVVERTAPGRDGGAATTTKQTYKKG